jgi:alpha/beta superfamily hydrolase
MNSTRTTPSRRIIHFGPEGKLYGVVHAPPAHSTRGFVICAPFAEEAKCAYRPLYEIADLAAAQGWTVLRFDYFGTGNSAGAFEDFTPPLAKENIAAAIAYLHEQGIERVGLLGLGLGATLAFEAVANDVKADLLILWQPIVSGEQFYKLNIKRQLVRQMLTHGKANGGMSTGDIIDLDGYSLRKSTIDQLKSIDLLDYSPATVPPTLLFQISFTQNMAPDLQALGDACHPAPTSECAVCEPFWKRIGFVDCSQVYDVTLEWLGTMGE